MDMRKLLSTVKRLLFPRPVFQTDAILDGLIREALLDEALVAPPPGAWERLLQTIAERNMKSHGMWVLDEPLHEPREVPAALVHGAVNRALRLQLVTRSDSAWHIRDSAWGNLMPTFAAYVNW
jgi:hypothetical protein